MLNRHWKMVVGFAFLSAVFAPAVSAGPIAYSVERGNLYRVDLADHSYEIVASTGVPGLKATALELTAQGELYGVGGGAGTLWLARFSTVDGTPTLIGEYPGAPMGIVDDGEGGFWIGIAEFSVDGTLLHVDAATGAEISRFRLNPVWIPALLVGEPGELLCLTLGPVPGGSSEGNRYGWYLEEIDPATGLGTVVRTLGIANETFARVVDGGDSDGRGGIWAAGRWGDFPPGSNVYSYQHIDIATGATTTTWLDTVDPETEPVLTSLAIFGQGSVAEIPALGPGGLAALAGLLGLAAVAVLRRRGRA